MRANRQKGIPAIGAIDDIDPLQEPGKTVGRTARAWHEEQKCKKDTGCAFSDTGLGSHA